MATTSDGASLERDAIGLTEVLFQSITFMAPAVADGAVDRAGDGVGRRHHAPGGRLRPDRLPVHGLLDEPARPAHAVGGRDVHVGEPRPWRVLRLARRVGLHVGRPDRPCGAVRRLRVLRRGLHHRADRLLERLLWLPLAVICGLVVWWLTYRGVEISTRTASRSGVIEIGIFLVVSLLLILNADARNTPRVFIPADGNVLPAFQGMVFCLLAFIGFEAAAPLGEESREPRSTIPRAIILSCLLIGLFYVFCYYAATVFFGPDRMQAEFLGFNEGNPWGGMANEVLPGIGSLLVAFAIVNSCLANSNAGSIASTRSIFSLGRAACCRRWFGAVHPTYQTPVTAVHVQALIGIGLTVGLGLLLAASSRAAARSRPTV